MEMALLIIKSNQTAANHRFLVANIGEDNLILGYPFFKAINPQIDWPMGVTKETITLFSHDKWTKGMLKLECVSWARKTIKVQQLAEEAMDKKERTWQELIPKQYHIHGKVFSKQVSEQFPGKRP